MENENYSTLGILLRAGREEKRLSLSEASQMMHIRVRYLEALEQGRLTELPGGVYIKGYLQAYASFLGLDKEEILRRFEQVGGSLGKAGFYLPQVFSKEKSATPWAVWGGLLVAIAIYAVWFFVLRPPQMPVSVVENFPQEKLHDLHIAPVPTSDEPLPPRDAACFKPETAYYPPCVFTKEDLPGLMPLHHQLSSMMQLGQ